jgi:hypothetical protein
MIKGVTKTEAQYRAVKMDSSSSLKDFSVDRKKYYKKYIKGEKVEDKDNLSATMGRIVETLLLEPEEFDNRFYMSACMSTPTGLMLDFVEALYRVTAESTNEAGEVTRTMADMTQEAYTLSGFKIKYEAVIAKFLDSDAQIYYDEIRKVRANNLTVVNTQDISNAERIVEELKTNFVTKDIVNLVNSSRYTILNQFQVEGYEVDGHLFKSMMDKVVIDHDEQTIQIYDLKCVWAVEGFYEEYYLYRRAYIQAYLYWSAMVHLAHDMNNEFYGYTVLYPQFMICDSTNYFNPLIYTLDLDDMQDAYHGFEHKGRKYPGVNSLIKDLHWAIENDVWNMSRENYVNNGKTNIKG